MYCLREETLLRYNEEVKIISLSSDTIYTYYTCKYLMWWYFGYISTVCTVRQLGCASSMIQQSVLLGTLIFVCLFLNCNSWVWYVKKWERNWLDRPDQRVCDCLSVRAVPHVLLDMWLILSHPRWVWPGLSECFVHFYLSCKSNIHLQKKKKRKTTLPSEVWRIEFSSSTLTGLLTHFRSGA